MDEAERAVHDALMIVKDVVTYPYIVAGGGAPEVEVAIRLNKFAEKISGKQQLAVRRFAEAMEVIPITLAENSGLDTIDIITELRHRHEAQEKWAGVDVHNRKVSDMYELNVIEPLSVKEQIIKSASAASSYLSFILSNIGTHKQRSQSTGNRYRLVQACIDLRVTGSSWKVTLVFYSSALSFPHPAIQSLAVCFNCN